MYHYRDLGPIDTVFVVRALVDDYLLNIIEIDKTLTRYSILPPHVPYFYPFKFRLAHNLTFVKIILFSYIWSVFHRELVAKISDNFRTTKFYNDNFRSMYKILSRIKTLADTEGISIGAIERAIGASRGVISKAIAKGTDIQAKWLELICEKFPQYSPIWLLTGDGSMLRNEIKTTQTPTSTPIQPSAEINFVQSPQKLSHQDSSDPLIGKLISTNKSSEGMVEAFTETAKNTPGAIPLVSEKAVGGFANEHFSIKERDVLAYYVIPKFRHLGVNFMIEVVGDSMIPKFYPGDIIACSIINHQRYIEWNKCHLIATQDRGLIIKRIMPCSDDEYLTAVSDNKDYPPFNIPKDEITGMARIVGVIHLE